jgi:biotin synthase-related radical SAM superfamily protein
MNQYKNIYIYIYIILNDKIKNNNNNNNNNNNFIEGPKKSKVNLQNLWF